MLLFFFFPLFFALHITPNTNSAKYKTRTATCNWNYLTPVPRKNKITTEWFTERIFEAAASDNPLYSLWSIFCLCQPLTVSKSNLSTTPFSTALNAEKLIRSLLHKLNFWFRVTPHTHIPRNTKHTVSQLLCISKDLLHFANSIKKSWERRHEKH